MAKKNLFDNLELTDNSYLLDEDMLAEEIKAGRSKEETILVQDLEEFPGHPFEVNEDTDDFEELVESIKENGLIYPILVRPVGEKYQIISGHRRAAASRVAELKEIPAIIRPMDDYEATVLMVHSNLYRSEVSIKEKALSYRMCHDAEKHQGKHSGGDTAASLGAKVSDSRRKVYRYIRLSYLVDNLLESVNQKKLAINIGVELSYLKENEQDIVSSVMEGYGIIPSLEQAEKLRELSGNITEEKIIAMLLGDEKKKSSKSSVSFKVKDLQDYFEPDTEPEKMTEIIVKLLKLYHDGALESVE